MEYNKERIVNLKRDLGKQWQSEIVVLGAIWFMLFYWAIETIRPTYVDLNVREFNSVMLLIIIVFVSIFALQTFIIYYTDKKINSGYNYRRTRTEYLEEWDKNGQN